MESKLKKEDMPEGLETLPSFMIEPAIINKEGEIEDFYLTAAVDDSGTVHDIIFTSVLLYPGTIQCSVGKTPSPVSDKAREKI